jgi:adenylyltransferase/sulfurtransferase
MNLAQSKVLIVGLGGLGSPVAMYLTAAGVGHLTLIDSDQVELTNLQRQIVHDTTQLGQPKTTSARHKLQGLNPNVQIFTYHRRLESDFLHSQVRAADVVADCSDNFATRDALNVACVRHRKPLVSGAAIRFSGQVTVFLPAQPDSPCYRCLYPNTEETAETCSQSGIIAPLVGIIGSIQALEILKVLLNLGQVLCGRLLLLDAYTMQWRTLKLQKDPACPVCQ